MFSCVNVQRAMDSSECKLSNKQQINGKNVINAFVNTEINRNVWKIKNSMQEGLSAKERVKSKISLIFLFH